MSELRNQKIIDSVNTLQKIVHDDWALPKGWWTGLKTGESLTCDYPAGERPTGSKSVGDQIALMHTELSEGYEGHRKNLIDDHCPEFTMLEVELADTVIRILDSAGGMKLRLAEALAAKMEFNDRRKDHLMSERVKEGGKST